MAAQLTIHPCAPHRELRRSSEPVGQITQAGKHYRISVNPVSAGRYHVQTEGLNLQLGDQGVGIYVGTTRIGWISHHGQNYVLRFDIAITTPLSVTISPSRAPRSAHTAHHPPVRLAHPR